MEPDGCPKRPAEVFSTLAKIRAASYRVGFNIWDLYKPLDPYNNKLISVCKFISVLAGPLKDIIGLTNEEIRTVAQYFRQADGRIMYHQFCNLIHGGDDDAEKEETKPEKSESDLYQRNKLLPEEEKYLLMMLTKIAVIVNRKKMILKPFFQDYSLVRKGSGLVSRSTIARVFQEIGVHLSSHDYNLLLRKYSTDSFTVSYIAFLEDLEEIRKYLEEHGALDLTGDLLPMFAGRLKGWELPQLPRPEIMEAHESLVGLPALTKPHYRGLSAEEVKFAMEKIRKHLSKEKLLVGSLLKKYDTSESGRVTQAQLRLALAEMSRDSSGLNPLSLTSEEVIGLGHLYADPSDKERVLWRAFVRDVHNDLTPEIMAKWPCQREVLLQNVADRKVRERQALTWAQMDHPEPPPQCLQDVLKSIKERLVKRHIYLKPSFLKYDTDRLGILNRQNLRKAMVDNCILCTEEEYNFLEAEYIKGGFFNYTDMLLDLDKIILSDSTTGKDAAKDKSNNFIQIMEKEKLMNEVERESDIIEVLAKIKKKLICARMRTRDYMKPLDTTDQGLLSVNSFTEALNKCKLDLTNKEMETVLSVFSKNNCVEYAKFCNTVDEESERPCLMRLPLKEAMALKQQGPQGFQHPFLNYDERRIASVVAKKLSDKVSLGQLDAFKSMDIHKTGLISKSQLMSQLQSMGILHTITMDELDTIIKAFGVIPDGQTSYSIDYKAFLNALDIVFKQYKAANS